MAVAYRQIFGAKGLLLVTAFFHCLTNSAVGGQAILAAGAAPASPSVVTNGFVFGVVSLDRDERSVSFPVVVNQRTGVVEYAVVTTTGKTHESIFRTEAQPVHVHVAMLLLGVQPANTNQFPPDLSAPPPGDTVRVEASWQEGNQRVHRALEELILNNKTHLPLAFGPWAYNGSYLARRNFAAQREGSIVSVHIDPEALVNNPRSGRDNDELHCVNSALLPPEGTPVTISMRLQPAATSSSKTETIQRQPAEAASHSTSKSNTQSP